MLYLLTGGSGCGKSAFAEQLLLTLPAPRYYIATMIPYGEEGAMLGAVAVSLGHDFPALLGFKGGKGIVCGLAVALVLDWRIALVILGVFVVVFAITRYVSLGSVLAALTFSAGFGVLHHDNIWIMVGGIFLGLLAVFMHRGNIVRLFKGTEKKVHLIHREKNKE